MASFSAELHVAGHVFPVLHCAHGVTLALGAAYRVSYQEEFVSGDAVDGAYVCHLVLADPDGWILTGDVTHRRAPATPRVTSADS